MAAHDRTGLAQALRHRATEAETRLWFHLRNRALDGYKFRRQVPIGRFVVDFFCRDALLVVEVDGSQHFEPGAAAQDAERTAYLRSLGLHVLRFDNRQVLTETEAVLETILLTLTDATSP